MPAAPHLKSPSQCKKPQVRMNTVRIPTEDVEAPSSVRAEGAGSNEIKGAASKS